MLTPMASSQPRLMRPMLASMANRLRARPPRPIPKKTMSMGNRTTRASRSGSAATAMMAMITPRTKALRTTSSVTSSRAMDVPRHQSSSSSATLKPRAATTRKSPEKSSPSGNQPAPMLRPASPSTENALTSSPITPRRFSENRIV